MASSVKTGGTWQALSGIHAKVSGTWQAVSKAYVRVAGVWQEVYSALSVVVSATKSVSAFAIHPASATASVICHSDGDMKTQINGGSAASYETWLQSGSTSEVWVECSIVSGTLSSGAGTGRFATTTTRTWTKQKTSGFGADTVVIDLDFYDASTGGNLLDSTRVTLTAEREP